MTEPRPSTGRDYTHPIGENKWSVCKCKGLFTSRREFPRLVESFYWCLSHFSHYWSTIDTQNLKVEFILAPIYSPQLAGSKEKVKQIKRKGRVKETQGTPMPHPQWPTSSDKTPVAFHQPCCECPCPLEDIPDLNPNIHPLAPKRLTHISFMQNSFSPSPKVTQVFTFPALLSSPNPNLLWDPENS